MQFYTAFDRNEETMRGRMLSFVRENESCFRRELLEGHVTGSCWVVTPAKEKVLLIHHVKLNKWLQPGGHCDGNENVFEVAVTELREETGITEFNALPVIFDLDIHTIPERKGVPEHEHFDVRFLFEVSDSIPLIQNHETHGLKWMELSHLESLTSENSILRMKSKTVTQ